MPEEKNGSGRGRGIGRKKMKCKETNKLFAAYLDNEATASERESMQAHLASCADCRKELEALSATQTKFRQTLEMVTGSVEPSTQAWATLREQILSEKEAAVARVLPPRETWWERMGKVSLLPRRLTLRTATAGVIAVILIIVASIGIPMLTGHDAQVSAAEIALADPQVQAALGGTKPDKIGTTENIGTSGTTRVVLAMSPAEVIIADIDMGTQQVKTVHVQIISDIMPDQIFSIAKTDQRVRSLLESGYAFDFRGTVQVTSTTFDERETEFLQTLGINNLPDFIGFTALISMESTNGLYQYLVWVNASTERVVAIVLNPLHAVSGIITTTVPQ